MYQAITTKYKGHTDKRGSRVYVRSEGGIRRSYEWDDGLNAQANHKKAAERFVTEMNWNGVWYGGAIATGVYAFVRASDEGWFKVDS